MTTDDLHRTIDSAVGTFLALMLMEGVLKPTARYLTRYLARKLDDRIHILPDWLHKDSDRG